KATRSSLAIQELEAKSPIKEQIEIQNVDVADLDAVGLASGIVTLILFLLVVLGKPLDAGWSGPRRAAITGVAVVFMSVFIGLEIRHRTAYSQCSTSKYTSVHGRRPYTTNTFETSTTATEAS